LTDWGYEVCTAHDGPSALQILHKDTSPKLVILDWMLPGMSGLELCRQVRQWPGTPYYYILLMTARAGSQDKIAGLEAGADDYLVKPVDVGELKARLGTAKRILSLQEQLMAAQEALRQQATHDPLTGLWNRTVILDTLKRELVGARRKGS